MLVQVRGIDRPLIVEVLDVGVQLGQHEVSDFRVGPVGRVRGDGRDVGVASLLEDVVHPVGQPLAVGKLHFLAGRRIRVAVVGERRRRRSHRRRRRRYRRAVGCQVRDGVAGGRGCVLHEAPKPSYDLSGDMTHLEEQFLYNSIT